MSTISVYLILSRPPQHQISYKEECMSKDKGRKEVKKPKQVKALT